MIDDTWLQLSVSFLLYAGHGHADGLIRKMNEDTFLSFRVSIS